MQPSKDNISHFIYKATQYFQIPDFQRPYTWDATLVQAFLDDLEIARTSNRNHYFGTVVYFPEADHFTIIDGQQRLTTTLLMLVAIYHILIDHPEKSSMSAQQIKDQYLYDQYGAPDLERKILLRTVTTDNVVFKKLFQGEELNAEESVNKQKKTFDQFWRYFIDRDQLETYIRALDRFEIIKVAVDSSDDEPQLIFESINSTGAPLSSGDKIRNYSLMLNNADARRHVYDRYWLRIEQTLIRVERNESIDDISGFYLHFLQSKASDRLSESEVYRRFKEFFTDSVGREHTIAQLDAYYHDLIENLNAYCFIKYGIDPYGDFSAFHEYNDRFRYLEFTPRISFLMDVLVGHARGEITEEEVNGIYKALEVFVVRRLLCKMGTPGLNQLLPTWFKAVRQLRTKFPEHALDDVFRRFLLDGRGRTRVFPNDSEVRNAVVNYPMGTYGNRNIAYILATIEDSLQPGESRLLSELQTSQKKLSVEHIMPQTLSNAWRRELGDNAESIHETWLNRISNLTLTGYNSTYSNKPFETKKTCPNGFQNSPLNINRHIAKYEVWNEAALKQREAWLIENILQSWPTLTSTLPPEGESRSGRHSIREELDLTRSNPIRVTIAGTEFPIANWRQFTETVGKQLYTRNPSIFETFLNDDAFTRPRGGRLVSGTRDELTRASEVVPGIYIEVNLNARQHCELALRMAEKYELEREIFYDLTD